MERAENPVIETATLVAVGMLCGSAFTFFMVGGRPADLAPFHMEEAPGSIVLFGPSTPVGHLINAGTGNGGYAHSSLDLGFVNDEQEPMFVDSFPGRGVHLRPVSSYGDRPVAVIPLSEEDTAYAKRQALKLLKEEIPFRGRGGGLSCGELVMCCMPPSKQMNGLVTPNDIANMYGVGPVATRSLKSRLLR